MSRGPDMNKIAQDCTEIVTEFNRVLEKKFGKDFLICDDEERFMHETAVVGMVANRMISIAASLVMSRIVEQGGTIDQIYPEMKQAVILDASDAADQALERVIEQIALLEKSRKKPTSH